MNTLNNKGYLEGSILGHRHLAHRIAWKMFYGADPVGEIDHLNKDRSDNRICNLREGPHRLNMRNQSLSSANTSGFCGVYFHKRVGRWQASIRVNGVARHLGYFDDIAAAVAARAQAEQHFGFSSSHGKRRMAGK